MLVLAYIGILLPGIPGIPFILFALFCFTAASEKMLIWMMKLPLIGKVITKMDKSKSKPWLSWLVASQLMVSAIVAERLLKTDIYFNVVWYTAATIVCLLFVYLLQKYSPKS